MIKKASWKRTLINAHYFSEHLSKSTIFHQHKKSNPSQTTVKLANFASPSKFRYVKFPKKLVLRMIKCAFHKGKLNAIDTVYEKHVYDSQDLFLREFDLAEFRSTGGIRLLKPLI